MKVRTKGVTICVYDKFHNLIEEFGTIKSATKYAGLSFSSVSKYITKKTLWNDSYYFKIKKK